MPKQYDQKSRLLFIRDYLLKNTDENNNVSTKEICNYLKHKEIMVDSRTVLSDIKALIEYGLDIEGERRFFIASREFELPELKLLMDSVLTSKFMTERKTEELVKKLSRLCSIYQAKEIQGKIYCNRIKSMNESIHFVISTIHESIQFQSRISFKYLQYTLQKDMKPRRNGKVYNVYPIALAYNDGYYYLLAYDIESNIKIKHYRVDKMENVAMLDSTSWWNRRPKEPTNLTEYIKEHFSMYGGGTQRVTIQFTNSLIGVVIDRFGKDTAIIKADDNHFKINVPVAISNQFFSWVFAFGEDVRILEPKTIVKQYKKMLKDVFDMYVVKRS